MKPPINGAEVDAALSGGLVQVDIAELLGDDPYQALLARQQENKVPLFKEQIKLAQQEQANCSQSQATSAGKKPCACSCERQIETAQQGQASCSQSQATSAGKNLAPAPVNGKSKRPSKDKRVVAKASVFRREKTLRLLQKQADGGMIFRWLARMLRKTDPRLLFRFAYNFGYKGLQAVRRFEKRRRTGQKLFPAFLMLSITDQCNLHCQGCWVSSNSSPPAVDSGGHLQDYPNANRHGSFFFGILGGEPLLYPGLFDCLAHHRRCYFQIFTNGTLLTAEVARRMRQLGNVTPLISIEGREQVSDLRRGGRQVYRRTIQALDNCRRQRLITRGGYQRLSFEFHRPGLSGFRRRTGLPPGTLSLVLHLSPGRNYPGAGTSPYHRSRLLPYAVLW